MKLEGECNRCGLCCTLGPYRCVHLRATDKLGAPGATSCAVYDRRYDGMPIIGVDAGGRPRVAGVCRKDSPKETAVIVQWIGKGCSLKRKD